MKIYRQKMHEQEEIGLLYNQNTFILKHPNIAQQIVQVNNKYNQTFNRKVYQQIMGRMHIYYIVSNFAHM